MQGIWDAEVQSGRKVIIAITDGDANQSQNFNLNTVLTEAARTAIPVYTIGLGRLLNPAVLTQIAEETGGIYYDLPTPAAMFQAYNSLQTALSEKWVLSFTQPSPTGGLHSVTVDATANGVFGSDTVSSVELCP